jgi:hypothetical protein
MMRVCLRAIAALAWSFVAMGCATSAPTTQPTLGAEDRLQAVPQIPARPADDVVILPTSPGTAGQFDVDATGREVRRLWRPSVARAPVGVVPAGATYYTSADAAPTRPDWQSALLDIGGFLWNTIKLPYEMARTPPWETVLYDGAEAPADRASHPTTAPNANP